MNSTEANVKCDCTILISKATLVGSATCRPPHSYQRARCISELSEGVGQTKSRKAVVQHNRIYYFPRKIDELKLKGLIYEERHLMGQDIGANAKRDPALIRLDTSYHPV